MIDTGRDWTKLDYVLRPCRGGWLRLQGKGRARSRGPRHDLRTSFLFFAFKGMYRLWAR
jgi:hypothetical protein